MSIKPLSPHYSMENPPTVYDEEALTALQLAARTNGKVNETVAAFNKLDEETTDHLNAQDTEITERLAAQDAAIPVKVNAEMDARIADGTFDKKIDLYAGNLEARLDNLLGKVTEGGTTMDAEIIDGRVGADNKEYASIGAAIREQIKTVNVDFAQAFSNAVLNFDFTRKVIELKPIDPADMAILFGLRKRYQAAANGFPNVALDISALPYGTYNVVFNGKTETIRLVDITHTIHDDATYNGEDIILASAFMYSGGVIHWAYLPDNSVTKDGVMQSNNANPVVQILDFPTKINIDTRNKTITFGGGIMQADNCIYYAIPESAISYADKVTPSGATFALMYAPEKGFFFVQAGWGYTGNVVHVVSLYLFPDLSIHGIYAHPAVQKVLYVDDAKYFADSTDQNNGNNLTSKIFRKVVCCGDSYTAGYMVDPDGVAHDVMEDYAWPHYMATLTGNEWVNCGHSGANVVTWQSLGRGLPKARAAGKTQAYIVGLMINDQSGPSGLGLELGTPSDIGTANATYYGGLSKVIRELSAISPKAKIFVCTCPKTGGNFAAFNEAARYVVQSYKGDYPVHCLDLAENSARFNTYSITNDELSGHYTAIGYEQFAEIMNDLLSEYINTHVDEFQDVPFIEYD